MQPTLQSQNTALHSLCHPSLGGELRALWQIFLREWRQFVRYPTWVIGLLIWPVLFPATYILSARALAGPDGSGLAIFLKSAGTQNFFGYIILGSVVWMWQNMVLWQVGFALRGEQKRGTLESNWMTPTWRFSFLFGLGTSQMITMFIFIIATLLEFGLIFGVRFNANLPMVLLVGALGLLSIYGLGFVFASLVIAAKEANTFVFLVRGFVMIFCGISYPISVMPVWMQSVANWLPPTVIIRAVRLAALNAASFNDLRSDLVTLLGMGVFWMITGYLLFQLTDRLAHRTGALSQF